MEQLLRMPHEVALTTDALDDLRNESQLIDYGMIVLCCWGSVRFHANFDAWTLTEGSVVTLFPGDVVMAEDASTDFLAQRLRYDAASLREASLTVEHSVYSQLRQDRFRLGETPVSSIVRGMLGLLGVFFSQENCGCLAEIVILQLQAFFLGYHDYLHRHPEELPAPKASPRVRELFNRFMLNLEVRYKETHAVADYAEQLAITPKYLNTIVREMTGHPTKVIINHFLALQIKLSLKRSTKSVRELAFEYHFDDDAFFCHFFKKQTGISPHQYRKKLKE